MEIENQLQKQISLLIEKYQNRKQVFVEERIIEKNYGHLIGTMKDLFPKIICINVGEWFYWFADNGTKEGAFIVGIRDKQNEYNITYGEDHSTNFKLEFEYVMFIPRDVEMFLNSRMKGESNG